MMVMMIWWVRRVCVCGVFRAMADVEDRILSQNDPRVIEEASAWHCG